MFITVAEVKSQRHWQKNMLHMSLTPILPEHKKKQINQDAVRLMKNIYDIDMEKTQYSKLIDDLPPIDISITMGCDVICPIVENQYTEDWNLDDPTGRDDEFFREIISKIEKNVKDLSIRIQNGDIY